MRESWKIEGEGGFVGDSNWEGEKIELVVEVLTGHTEMKWATGEEISKPDFLKEGHFITGIVGVHYNPVCKDTQRRELSIFLEGHLCLFLEYMVLKCPIWRNFQQEKMSQGIQKSLLLSCCT